MNDVICGFDGSEPATEALHWAFGAAQARQWPLRVVQSWWEPALGLGPGDGFTLDPEAQRRELEAAVTAEVAEIAQAWPGVDHTYEMIDAKPAAALLDAAGPEDLLVVGARGKGGFLGLHLGSVSARLARDAAGPVVIVRSTEGDVSFSPDGPVVVGVDPSPGSRHALRWAADHAAVIGAPLQAVMAWSYLQPIGPDGPEAFRPDYHADDAMAALRQIVDTELGDRAGEVDLQAPCDLVSDALLQRAGSARLLVVGTRGGHRAGFLGMGSVSQQIVHHAPGPVAVVPAPPS